VQVAAHPGPRFLPSLRRLRCLLPSETVPFEFETFHEDLSGFKSSGPTHLVLD
jgi:hypothetical protein